MRAYTITLTLTVSDEDGDGVYVVTGDVGRTFGDGDSPYAAVADYFACKAELMDDLWDERANLAPGLREEFAEIGMWAMGGGDA